MVAEILSVTMSVKPKDCNMLTLTPYWMYSKLIITGKYICICISNYMIIMKCRLLKLRNPHGHGTRQSWNGDWSDGSSRWTDQLKQQLLPHGANQGIFWICLRDLMKYDIVVTMAT